MNKREAQNISNQVIAALKEKRLQKGISQYKLAKDTGISKSSILYIENQTQQPSLYTVILIADYLGLQLDSLFKNLK